MSGLSVAVAVLVVVTMSGCGARAGSVSGRAVSRGGGVAGATVEVYLSGGQGKESAPFSTASSGADGTFRLELPAGKYWVWVKDLASAEGPRRLAEYSGNPVQVAAGRALALGDVELHDAGRPREAAAPPGAGVRGRVVHEGRPAEETAVMVYDAGSARQTGPGYVALVRTEADGRFQVDLAPGAYRLAARRRLAGGSSGHLQAGDLSATAPHDPLTVPPAGYVELGDLELHEVDAGRLGSGEARESREAAPAGIEGRVLGPDGEPRAGQFVFAYRDGGMIGRPEAMARTGEGGAFSLTLPSAGTYYLGARSRHGGPRQPGEWAGKLAGRADSGLEVPAGRLVKGATIIMEQVW